MYFLVNVHNLVLQQMNVSIPSIGRLIALIYVALRHIHMQQLRIDFPPGIKDIS